MSKKSVLLTACLMALAPCAMAAQGYLTASTVVNGQPTTDFLGKVTVTTPVDIVAKKGDYVKVRVSGWSLKEYPAQIFKAPGVRIEYAAFDEEQAVKLNPAKGEQVVQDNVWVRSSAEGWVSAKSVTTDIKGLWAKAKARHADACSTCHGAPKADHFTANQWASLLPERGGRTGHTRKGPNELMFKWLQENAKR